MSQTQASKDAIARDHFLCQWHLHHHNQIVGVFDYRPGFIQAYAGTHHVFRRRNVDETEAIISLCAECHSLAENARIKKIDLVALLSQITGINLFEKYRAECKWSEAEWQQSVARTGPLRDIG